MNRNEFYNNIQKYKENQKVEHSAFASKLLGKVMDNAKYYKRIGNPGNYKYFYTKEEYDAFLDKNKSGAAAEAAREANKKKYESGIKTGTGKGSNNDNGSAADAARREAEKRQQYEDQKKAEQKAREEYEKDLKEQEKKEQEYSNNDTGATVKKYADLARNSSPDAAAKAFVKDSKEYKAYVDAVKKGLKDGSLYIRNNGENYVVEPTGKTAESWSYYNDVIGPLYKNVFDIMMQINRADSNNNNAFEESFLKYETDIYMKDLYDTMKKIEEDKKHLDDI